MSMDKKMALATREARDRERIRCLWILGKILERVELQAADKLASPAELRVLNIRLQITRALCKNAQALILSGVTPPPPSESPAPAGDEDLLQQTNKVLDMMKDPAVTAWCSACGAKLEEIKKDSRCPTCRKFFEIAKATKERL